MDESAVHHPLGRCRTPTGTSSTSHQQSSSRRSTLQDGTTSPSPGRRLSITASSSPTEVRPAPLPSALLVWGTGVIAYVIAVAGRTSLGVAGLQAVDRFSISGSTLSMFAMVQLAVYAAAQLPVGIVLDRLGSRKVITAGVVILSTGQILLAVVSTVGPALVARVFIGMGDAAVLISVLRLIPIWFRPRLAPLLTQITGLMGQFGQIISAVPFLALLFNTGWTPAFTALGVIGFLVAVLVAVIVRNRPPCSPADPSPAAAAHDQVDPLPVLEGLRRLCREPGAWLGLFVHYVTLFPANVFLLLWGVPFLTEGQQRSPQEVSALLTIGTVGGFVIAPVLGELSARFPARRSQIVLGVVAISLLTWITILVPTTPRPYWHLAILLVVVSGGVVACTMGFDFPRTLVSHRYLGSATGMVNIGGYTASVAAIFVFGSVLDRVAPSGHYELGDFRLAFLALVPLLVLGLIGLLVARRSVLRKLGTRA